MSYGIQRIPFLIALFWFLLHSSLLSAEPLQLTADESIEVAPFLDKYIGPETDSFQKVAASSRFESFHSGLYFGVEPGKAGWYRFTVTNDSPGEFWYVSLSSLQFDRVELFIPGVDGNPVHKIFGDTIPISRWSNPDLYFAFPIYLKQGETKTLYLKMQNKFQKLTRAAISGPLTFSRNRAWLEFFLIMLLVVTGIFLLYIGNLYRIYKNNEYLYLAPVGIVFFFFNVVQQGPVYYFWPEWPWFQDKITLNTGLVLILVVIGYLRLYLRVRDHQPVMDRIVKIFLSLNLLLLVMNNLHSSETFLKILMLDGVIAFLIGIVMVVRSRSYGYNSTDLVILFGFLSGTVMYRVGVVLSVFPYTIWYDLSLVIQLPLTLLFLSRLLLQNVTNTVKNSKDLEARYNELKARLVDHQKREPSVRINGQEAKRILDQINELVEESPAFFDPDFDLKTMADLLAIRPDQLSHILNHMLHVSFSTFLNTIRVHHTCELMRLHPDRTITRIMLDAGFSSKSAFNSAFKKVMDLSPSKFRSSIDFSQS